MLLALVDNEEEVKCFVVDREWMGATTIDFAMVSFVPVSDCLIPGAATSASGN